MYIEELKVWHRSMMKLQLSVDVFEYTYNSVECDVLFETDYKKGFSLTFIQKRVGTMLVLPVVPYFNLIIDQKIFLSFRKFFQIDKTHNGPFRVNDFLFHLRRFIPKEAKLPSPSQKRILARKFNVEEHEKIYYKGLVNWEKARALNPDLNRTRRPENLEKTKILYPSLYHQIKDYDISVRYEADFNNNLDDNIKQDLKSLLDELKSR
ncbi:DUF6037 family protein [Listeria seeligeri]|uniref:Uncharacterized protein n=1 Tax=Listeria seeligeri TaxID=1640 RepID=A0A7T0MB32_LISSE|nr:DUF6037 family protein [Listeria seeligeri]MBC1917038.1 hypothetical protein [Listeria seeligeri]QPL19426.1 hypothetical protein pLIS400456 [Listeria seeligeri]